MNGANVDGKRVTIILTKEYQELCFVCLLTLLSEVQSFLEISLSRKIR